MSDDKFNDEMLRLHNAYRRDHQAPPLKISPEMTKRAQTTAQDLAKTDHMHHTNSHYGENLFNTRSSKSLDMGQIAEMACQAWYSEVNRYKFGSEPKDLCSGHFTQMVWCGTTEMGAGRAQAKSGTVYVVCNYNPAGNFLGKFARNVLPTQT